MTQEDRKLLLTDLYARLPYRIKFKDENEECIREIHYIRDEDIYIREYRNLPYWIDTIKPYLRSLSSMTEEEKSKFLDLRYKINLGINIDLSIYRYLIFLYSHHIDIDNRLLHRGLALEAPKDMYNIK